MEFLRSGRYLVRIWCDQLCRWTQRAQGVAPVWGFLCPCLCRICKASKRNRTKCFERFNPLNFLKVHGQVRCSFPYWGIFCTFWCIWIFFCNPDLCACPSAILTCVCFSQDTAAIHKNKWECSWTWAGIWGSVVPKNPYEKLESPEMLELDFSLLPAQVAFQRWNFKQGIRVLMLNLGDV